MIQVVGSASLLPLLGLPPTLRQNPENNAKDRGLAPRYNVQQSMPDKSCYWRCYESNATLAQNWEGEAWQSRKDDGPDLADQGDNN